MVESLSLEDFILAFRRFVSRRSLPSIIYTDNARTYKAASATMQARFGKEIVCWKNICPLSPNWGGWWERLVRTVKSALKKSLGKQSVPKTELSTLLPEIEACVNSRPLSYVSDSGVVLTPSHFLIGRGTPLSAVELDKFENITTLSARYEFEEALSKQFWKLWQQDYLRNLPRVTAKKDFVKGCLRVGSVVLIKDDKKSRIARALGKVLHLFEGIDGKIRAVRLQTEKGTLVRSIQQLCLLEDRHDDPIDQELEVSYPHVNSQIDPLLGEGQRTGHANIDSNPGTTRSGRLVNSRKTFDL